MANLDSAHTWRRFAPDIGANLELPEGEQLLLEVASGITFTQLREVDSVVRGGLPEEEKISVLSKYVRIVGGPHTIGGETVATLADYWRVVCLRPGLYSATELLTALGHFNSVSEAQAHFSERRSGGTAFTPPRSAAKKDEKTAGR